MVGGGWAATATMGYSDFILWGKTHSPISSPGDNRLMFRSR